MWNHSLNSQIKHPLQSVKSNRTTNENENTMAVESTKSVLWNEMTIASNFIIQNTPICSLFRMHAQTYTRHTIKLQSNVLLCNLTSSFTSYIELTAYQQYILDHCNQNRDSVGKIERESDRRGMGLSFKMSIYSIFSNLKTFLALFFCFDVEYFRQHCIGCCYILLHKLYNKLGCNRLRVHRFRHAFFFFSSVCFSYVEKTLGRARK